MSHPPTGPSLCLFSNGEAPLVVVVAQPLLDVPIYGRISSLQLYRPKVWNDACI